MNNLRIKELDKQATEHETGICMFGEFKGKKKFNKQKFAKLIIEECSLVCKMNPHFDNYQLANIIKIHFGVEE